MICLILLIGASIFFGAFELYKSFGKEPFRYGSECFVNRPVTKDGWTSGLFEMKMPKGSSEAVMILDPLRPDVSLKHPLTYKVDIVDRNITSIASLEGKWEGSSRVDLHISRPTHQSSSVNLRDDSIILRLGGCYVPRDFGVSLDDRLLGVRILSISYH